MSSSTSTVTVVENLDPASSSVTQVSSSVEALTNEGSSNYEPANLHSDPSSRVISRRQSIRPTGNPNDSIAPLSNEYNSIIQNIPESLPTTPGYEFEQKIFENSFKLNQKHQVHLPVQQDVPPRPLRPNLYRKESKPILDRWNSLSDVFNKLLVSRTVNVSVDDEPSDATNTDTSAYPGEMTFHNPPKNLWRVVSCCLWCFTIGFSDGAPGALLPYIEEYYNISYSIVSLIWMSNAVGYIVVALLAHKIEPLLKKQMSLVVGSFCSVIMFVLVSIGYKFPLTVVGFFFGGIGLAITISQMNIFLSRLEKSSTALGYYHGSYGVGATIAPLIATQFVNNGIKWHFYYIILAAGMFCNGLNIYFAFSGADTDLAPWDFKEDAKIDIQTPLNGNHEENMIGLRDLTREGGQVEEIQEFSNTPAASHSSGADEDHANTNQHKVFPKSDLYLAMHNRLTWLLCLFVLFYQGAEVSMGGWVVTFLLKYRQGNPASVGYVVSGYWCGLSLGRLFLTRPFHKYIGARRAIIISAVLSIVFVILTWVIPNVIAAGVFVSLAGVFVGPTYPLMITLAAKMLPRKIQVISLTIMTAFGSSGGAIFPFLVGLISQFVGPYVVHPIFIALYSLMLIIWLGLPNIEREGKGTFLQRLW